MMNFILKYVAGNLDNLISFLTQLDKYLDEYAAKQKVKVSEIQTKIDEQEAEKAKVIQQASLAKNLQAGVRSVTNTN